MKFDGLGMNLGSLPRLSAAKSRSISPENFAGEKGNGGMATEGTGAGCARDLGQGGQGWKISPSIKIAAGEERVIADIKGSGAIQQIWMTPTGNWRFSILRIYWDDQTTPSVECPVWGLFCLRVGEVFTAVVAGGLCESGKRFQLLLGDAVSPALPDDDDEYRRWQR